MSILQQLIHTCIWEVNPYVFVSVCTCIYTAHFESVSEGKMKITGESSTLVLFPTHLLPPLADVCIACGALDVYTDHPLFEGGLCEECKVRVVIGCI